MRKTVSVLLLVALVFGCCGCSMISALKGDSTQRERYLQMTTQDLAALSDEELLTALRIRTEEKANTEWNLGDGAAKLPEAQRVFYVISCFYTEQENGGLCRFFVNGTRNLAPLVSDSLAVLGATEHQALFDTFVKDNEISTEYLIYFIINDESEFAQKRAHYPFDDYDVPYKQLPSLKEMLLAYAREHIGEY